jgi:hypothetical protein
MTRVFGRPRQSQAAIGRSRIRKPEPAPLRYRRVRLEHIVVCFSSLAFGKASCTDEVAIAQLLLRSARSGFGPECCGF